MRGRLHLPGIGDTTAAEAAHTDVGLFAVAGKTLQRIEAAAIFADQCRSLVGGATPVSRGLQELAHPQTAHIARRPLRGQGVVGADQLCTEADTGAAGQEQCPVVGHDPEE